MSKNLHWTVFVIIVLVVSGCRKKLVNDGKPCFLSIGETELQITDPVVQGTASQQINDLWLELEGTDLGVWSPNSDVPIAIEPGNYKIIISPGVKRNGLGLDRKIYPFFMPYVANVDLTTLGKTVIKPKFSYRSGTLFPINANFESGNEFTSAMEVINGSEVFEGASCGRIQVTGLGNSVKAELLTGQPILPGKPVFIEMNYKSETSFYVGIRAFNASGGTVFSAEPYVFFPKDSWNKLYLDFSSQVSELKADSYTFFIRPVCTDSTATQSFLLDNFKLVHF